MGMPTVHFHVCWKEKRFWLELAHPTGEHDTTLIRLGIKRQHASIIVRLGFEVAYFVEVF